MQAFDPYRRRRNSTRQLFWCPGLRRPWRSWARYGRLCAAALAIPITISLEESRAGADRFPFRPSSTIHALFVFRPSCDIMRAYLNSARLPYDTADSRGESAASASRQLVRQARRHRVRTICRPAIFSTVSRWEPVLPTILGRTSPFSRRYWKCFYSSSLWGNLPSFRFHTDDSLRICVQIRTLARTGLSSRDFPFEEPKTANFLRTAAWARPISYSHLRQARRTRCLLLSSHKTWKLKRERSHRNAQFSLFSASL